MNKGCWSYFVIEMEGKSKSLLSKQGLISSLMSFSSYGGRVLCSHLGHNVF